MSGSVHKIGVVIPLSIRRRNGRPKILPPEDHCAREGRTQDPHGIISADAGGLASPPPQ
jgi:hypothetical protein